MAENTGWQNDGWEMAVSETKVMNELISMYLRHGVGGATSSLKVFAAKAPATDSDMNEPNGTPRTRFPRISTPDGRLI